MASAALPNPGTAASHIGGFERGMITVAVMLGTLMQVLDTTIANVALPHMQTSLGATPESITWVLTSYIVASAIAIPITGWLSERVGRKGLFLFAVIGFTVTSLLCAIAQNMPEMVIFRAAQGISGAFLVPLAQSVMLDINPPERHAKAMAMFGGGIMIGPILGPVLGGWLTDSFNWRWVFLVNLPVGVIATVMALRYLPETGTMKRRFDLFGFALLALAVGALQLMLDRGETAGWFDSTEIWIEGGIAVAAAWMFGVHMMTAKRPIFEPHMFADRNLATALFFMAVTGVLLLAGLALLPPLLQRLFGYSVLQSGFLTAPRGVGTLISMVLAGKLLDRIDARVLIFAGISLMGISLWQMSGFTLDMDSRPIIVSGVVQGLGLGLIFVPLNTLAFGTLAPHYRTTAASLLNLSRNLGGSIGISMVTMLLARNIQISHADLSQHMTEATIPPVDPGIAARFSNISDAGLAMIDAEINRQAAMIAYIDDFHVMMLVTFAVLPLVFLLRKAKPHAGPPVMAD
ncbi:DHA2 family efflux MFS transporter permease subunit [Allosphingosinicella indica]|uniref:MFS transporter, DHA2 family, multidrug resistance protein n=1 Tax=Allosphingosinicella indica TaxID=941907 RepID=A0A1X7GGH7_9SPHN|nr:DHA2 family efflux MFS transporter permease subunit [Allosphingosinicella indica]SMF69009.1 MFS transporter, DHA2 family, multidrug resistance protein [Allosphingosinicella indica]